MCELLEAGDAGDDGEVSMLAARFDNVWRARCHGWCRAGVSVDVGLLCGFYRNWSRAIGLSAAEFCNENENRVRHVMHHVSIVAYGRKYAGMSQHIGMKPGNDEDTPWHEPERI